VMGVVIVMAVVTVAAQVRNVHGISSTTIA